MKIYFAGSITGGRDDKELYLEIIGLLGKYGKVLTKHIGDKTLSAMGEDSPTDNYIYNRNMTWLNEADVVVAEVTTPSLGVWRVSENGRIEAEVFDSGIWGGVVEYRVEEEHTKNYGYLFLSLLITAAVFEGVRRAFYYITLGTINPQK